jgi:hypothetical protein
MLEGHGTVKAAGSEILFEILQLQNLQAGHFM